MSIPFWLVIPAYTGIQNMCLDSGCCIKALRHDNKEEYTLTPSLLAECRKAMVQTQRPHFRHSSVSWNPALRYHYSGFRITTLRNEMMNPCSGFRVKLGMTVPPFYHSGVSPGIQNTGFVLDTVLKRYGMTKSTSSFQRKLESSIEISLFWIPYNNITE